MLAIFPAVAPLLEAQEADSKRSDDDVQTRLRHAAQQIKGLELRKAIEGEETTDKANDRDKDIVELIERPLLIYGDSARLNENGTLWAFGKEGRPWAFVELFQNTGFGTAWTNCVTLTSLHRVVMATPIGIRWTPEKTQIEPALLAEAPAPHAKESMRLRQMKDLARRFTAHEFWDPNNSRFELRLLVQPVHRYSDAKSGVHDGAVFILAHGTNPEVILLIEALGETLEASRWHFSLARESSAELHVEVNGKEVWKCGRAQAVAGKPTDPYWLFMSPSIVRK